MMQDRDTVTMEDYGKRTIYRMALSPMTLSEAGGHLYNTRKSGNTRVLTTVCLHINRKVHAACDLNFTVKDEGLLKVTGSHTH